MTFARYGLPLAICVLLGACEEQQFYEGEASTPPRKDSRPADIKKADAGVHDSAGDGVNWDALKGTDSIKGCNPQTFSLKQSPPSEVFLVLDRSGSMAEQGSSAAVTKWQELSSAVDFVLQQFESSIRFGLLIYPSDNKCKTPGPQVPVGLGNRKAVLHFLQQAKPAGGTPIFAALNNASKSLKDLGDKVSPKFLILATDGGPNCNYLLSASPSCSCTMATASYCCTSYPSTCYASETCLDEKRVLTAINDLKTTQKISTFVIGLEGTAEYKNLLDAMAKTGGMPQTGATTSYYKASNKTQLQTALQKIAGRIISCEIDLAKKPDYPKWVSIYIDGKKIPRDTQKLNGWDYANTNLTKIKLYGIACKMLQDGKQHKVTATFACVPN